MFALFFYAYMECRSIEVTTERRDKKTVNNNTNHLKLRTTRTSAKNLTYYTIMAKLTDDQLRFIIDVDANGSQGQINSLQVSTGG